LHQSFNRELAQGTSLGAPAAARKSLS
jgi:hypothetical protein